MELDREARREATWPRRRYGSTGTRDTHALCIYMRRQRLRRKSKDQVAARMGISDAEAAAVRELLRKRDD